LDDEALPTDTDGVYMGGGFPELYATDIAANHRMRDSIKAHVGQQSTDVRRMRRSDGAWTGPDDVRLPMIGVLPVALRMQRETLTIGYREVTALRTSALMPVGTRVRGHEFHWSVADPPPAEVAAYRMLDAEDRLEGFCVGSTLASYVHLNLAGAPQLARHFVASCARGPA